VGERVPRGAVDLGHAAQRVVVLDAAASAVRLADRAPLEQAAQIAALAAAPGWGRAAVIRGSKAASEPPRRVERRGADEVRGARQLEGAQQSESADGDGHLDPVDEREPSFAPSDTGRGARGAAPRPPAVGGRARGLVPRRSAPARGARAARGRPRRRPTLRRNDRQHVRVEHPRSAWTVATRTPERPRASAFARSTIIARTARSPSGGPTPAAWLRTRLRCSASSSPRGIATSANLPKPVVTP
jgi:hypothetical protein